MLSFQNRHRREGAKNVGQNYEPGCRKRSAAFKQLQCPSTCTTSSNSPSIPAPCLLATNMPLCVHSALQELAQGSTWLLSGTTHHPWVKIHPERCNSGPRITGPADLHAFVFQHPPPHPSGATRFSPTTTYVRSVQHTAAIRAYKAWHMRACRKLMHGNINRCKHPNAAEELSNNLAMHLTLAGLYQQGPHINILVQAHHQQMYKQSTARAFSPLKQGQF